MDYLPDSDGVYNLVGFEADDQDVEYSYLGKDEKVPLVKMQNGHSIVFPIPGY